MRAVLEQARRQLEGGWCRFAMATDAAGKTVTLDDPSAQKFCLIGALRYGAGQTGPAKYWTDAQSEAFNAAVACIRSHLGKEVCVSLWNDRLERTQEQVVALLTEVIAWQS